MINPIINGANIFILLPTLFSIIDRIPLAPIPKGINEIIVPIEKERTSKVPYKTLPADAAHSKIPTSIGHKGKPLTNPNIRIDFLLFGLTFLNILM